MGVSKSAGVNGEVLTRTNSIQSCFRTKGISFRLSAGTTFPLIDGAVRHFQPDLKRTAVAVSI